MKTTINICSRILFLTGLLALAGCGQGQGDGSETTSTSAAEAGDQASTTEQPTSSTQPESTAEPTDKAADGSGTSGTASTESDASGSENHTVTARSTAYDPMVLKIEPGDTVNWVNMGGHNNNFEEGNIPAEAEPWRTSIGQDVDRRFEHEGLYLYKCDPHFSLGMVGAIIVGEPDNVAEVEENAKGMYKRALAKAKKQIE